MTAPTPTLTPTTTHAPMAPVTGSPVRVPWTLSVPAVAVTLGATAATAHGGYEVAIAAHVPAAIAWLYPMITDGLALIGYWATTRLSGAALAYAWCIVVGCAGVSGAAQAVYLATGALHTAPPALCAGVGAWPAIAAALGAHLLHLLAKPARPATTTATTTATTSAAATSPRPGPAAPEARPGADPQPTSPSATEPAPTTPTEQILPTRAGDPIETPTPDQHIKQAPGQLTDLPVPPRAPSARPDGDAGTGQDRPTAPAVPPAAGPWAGPTPPTSSPSTAPSTPTRPAPVSTPPASTTSPSSTTSTPTSGPAVRPVPGTPQLPSPGTGRTPTTTTASGAASGDELPERARELLAPGRAVVAELAAAGEPLTHARLVAGIRGRGHTCSTGTGQSLLAALRHHDQGQDDRSQNSGGQPARRPAGQGPERSAEQLQIPEHDTEHDIEHDIEHDTEHDIEQESDHATDSADVDERRGARAGAA